MSKVWMSFVLEQQRETEIASVYCIYLETFFLLHIWKDVPFEMNQ